MTNIDWTPLISALVLLLSTIITYAVIPPIRAQLLRRGWMDEARILVSAAEKMFPVEQYKEKKAYVHDMLKKQGINYDAEKVDAMIESAVYDVKGCFIEVEAAPITGYAEPKDTINQQ